MLVMVSVSVSDGGDARRSACLKNSQPDCCLFSCCYWGRMCDKMRVAYVGVLLVVNQCASVVAANRLS